MADWQSTTGFMPRPIKYVCPYWHFSISGAWNSREHRLHLGDKLRKCQLGHTYSSHISKAPLFGPSVDHLCCYTTSKVDLLVEIVKMQVVRAIIRELHF